MHYATIKDYDIANGTGVRVSVFVSGCNHRCPNCFNQEAWDFTYGQVFTQETIEEIIQKLDKPHITGLTILGGEPLELPNQKEVLHLIQEVKKRLPNKTIWLYTGFLYHEVNTGGRLQTAYTEQILSHIDVLVDGLFIEKLKDIRLTFRGSSNQTIYHLNNREE